MLDRQQRRDVFSIEVRFELMSFGIGRDQLFDPCINTYVGAWILAQNISRLGYGWDAIGAYNARSPEKRAAYARRIAAKVKAWRS